MLKVGGAFQLKKNLKAPKQLFRSFIQRKKRCRFGDGRLLPSGSFVSMTRLTVKLKINLSGYSLFFMLVYPRV